MLYSCTVKKTVAICLAAGHDCLALFIRQCHPKLKYQTQYLYEGKFLGGEFEAS